MFIKHALSKIKWGMIHLFKDPEEIETEYLEKHGFRHGKNFVNYSAGGLLITGGLS